MTVRNLSPAATRGLTAEHMSDAFIVLLTFTHPTLAKPLCVANNNADIRSGGVDYIGMPFGIELPGDNPDEPGIALVEVPNVDREIVAAIRAISGAPGAELRVVLGSQPDVVEIEYVGLSMRDTEYDVTSVKGRLTFETITTEPMTLQITPDRFPGMF